MTPQERREECRREVLRFVAERSVLAHSAERIANGLRRHFDFALEEVTAALDFEHGAGRMALQPNPQGKDRYYKVTAEGILFNENNP